jgi:hypothetical protein
MSKDFLRETKFSRDIHADVFGDLKTEDTEAISRILAYLWAVLGNNEVCRDLESHIRNLVEEPTDADS